MYNDSIMILLCVFAVYGAYALLREAAILILRKSCAVAAVRILSDMDADTCREAIRTGEEIASTHLHFERKPVLLCEIPPSAELSEYGYEIYVKQADTEE